MQQEDNVEINTDEKEIVTALQKGQMEAVHILVNRCGNRLFKAAFLLCQGESEAQDLVQETLYQALKSMKKFKGASSVYTWLYGILLNVNRQYRRKKKFLHLPGFSPHVKSDDNIDIQREIEQDLDMEKVYSTVLSLLKTLAPRHREVLVLRYFEDLKIKEIAEILAVSPGTVKSRLHYATSYLRKKIPKHLNLFANRDTNKNKRRIQ
jgi:RNA polymerase sigma-70 factor (ECF subfamily)